MPTPEEIRTQTIARIRSDPGLPLPDPTTSAWQIPPHPLANIQSPILPTQTDILIIGSGITACSITSHLLSSPSPLDGDALPDITILEARTLCSGATGRNGGHVSANPVFDYSELIETVSKDEARKIIHFRLAHYGMMHAAMQEIGGAELLATSEIREVESCTGILHEEAVDEMRSMRDEAESDIPELKGRVKIYKKGDEGFEDFRMSGVAGIAVEASAAMWPYRMVTGIFAQLLSQHHDRLHIETETPALSIAYTGLSEYPYAVTTPRGVIQTKSVVHANNGFTGHLLPKLRGSVFACKGHMTVQVPGVAFPRKGDRSWSVTYDAFGLDYITQNVQTGELWYGGGLIRGKDKGMDSLGDADDRMMDVMTRVHLHGAAPVVFGKENWGGEAEGTERVRAEWSGIMGFTTDGLPLVGQLPENVTGREGKREWIAAGFSGYGMVNCWGSGKALAELMLKGSVGEEFPESYLVTEDRLKCMEGDDILGVFLDIVDG